MVAVSASHLVDGSGATIRLLGVDRSGTEYACEQGWGIFDGPSDAASVDAIAGWHVNALRLPLNEGCWLGLFTRSNDPYAIADPTPYEGAVYRTAISNYVNLLHQRGIAVILELSGLDAPDGLNAPPMADAANSPTFWSSVANYFGGDPGVLFDLYNEPNSISWPCWRSGCTVATSVGSYQSAGMQQLVDAVRGTGATQPIMVGGLRWSSDETEWATYMPTDPRASLVVSFHTYDTTNCNTLTCWNSTLAPLTESFPVVAGEIGEYDCATAYTNSFMQFADGAGISYLGWAWDAIAPGGWQCGSPSLISSYDGTPSPEGVALQSHLLALFDGQGSLPHVTKLNGVRGPGAGGTHVVVRGTNFVGALTVRFGTEPATIVRVDRAGTFITVTAPAHGAATVDVTVTNNAGTSAVAASDQFTYLGPTVRSLSPRSGPSAGGATVLIHGAFLQGTSAVSIDGAAATIESVNRAGTTVTILAPAHSPGTVEVTVTTPGGTSDPKPYTYT